MTNREKYAEQIIDMATDGTVIAVNKKGELCDCHEITCGVCIGYPNDRACRGRIKGWFEQEYVETTVDWSKVPVDAKIFVRDPEDEPWKRRHFARYKNNVIYAWNDGSTSYTADGCDDVTGWKYAKLAEEDNNT